MSAAFQYKNMIYPGCYNTRSIYFFNVRVVCGLWLHHINWVHIGHICHFNKTLAIKRVLDKISIEVTKKYYFFVLLFEFYY